MAQPKLSDVAEVAGVSPTTVSRVLNNRGYLSQAVRDRVHAAMEEIGYRPNAVARTLQGQRSHLVGVIFPSVAHPFYGQMAASIESALARAGYRVMLCNSDDHPEREQKQLDMLLANQVDGLITGAHSHVVANHPGLQAPLVTIDHPHPGEYPNISCDNRTVAAAVVRGLVERGSRRPVHLSSSQNPRNLRWMGYVDAMVEAGLEPHVVRTRRGAQWTEDDAAVAEGLDLLVPDAVVAGNDVLAASALRWAEARGRRVPRDVQVIGFDGTAPVRSLLPHLSTVVQPFEELAERAVGRLVAAIDGVPAPAGSDVLPARIHWGGTTRPAPEA